MFIAMNRFKVKLGEETYFEEIWKNRDTHLNEVPGFKKFNLIKSESNETYTLYASHSEWETKQDFINWTKSEAFRMAHKNAGEHKTVYLDHPKFEGFEVVI
tara:strand:+ start:30 stop:332 length:303 start_codon:yes stop_codon:yes gene_type:complete